MAPISAHLLAASADMPSVAIVWLGVICSIVGWAVVATMWTKPTGFGADDHFWRILPVMMSAFTFGTGFAWSRRLASDVSGGHALAVGLQAAFFILTLVTLVLCFTTFWFNRPRFLAPRRYRGAIGRWQERKQEKEQQRRP